MKSLKYLLLLLLFFINNFIVYSQEVSILNYAVVNGRVQLEVASTQDNYYILKAKHNPADNEDFVTSITLGEAGTTIITEPLGAYPLEHYQVLEYSIAAPADTDGDGIDDIAELADMPTQGPLNSGESVNFNDGAVSVNNLNTFKDLSFNVGDQGTVWSDFLEDKEFVKFVIFDLDTDPQVYFINSVTHDIHGAFVNAAGLGNNGWYDVSGEIIYSPTAVSSNGTLGTFSFAYTFGQSESFETVQRTYEAIGANMPFLKNNLSYFVTEDAENDYNNQISSFNDSRVLVTFESQVYEDVDYLPLHIAEGYGFFRLMTLDETPSSKDVVLYESLPNTLPRVGGIMTSFIQTPLSHVNLRAIQDDLPNAFIREPLLVDSIANLIGKYVYYRVDQDKYFIREATIDEVNDWFEDIRPTEEQIPALDLTQTEILPLDEIEFEMSDAFGAKCTNVATMRNFGFPDGTVPDGFGVPFYFYQEFMNYNGFFDQVETMLADTDFQNDLETRIQMLKDFRREIKDADMPQWMLDELQTMHDAFPEGTAVRCRSSTNNEDLPGFSGAGLYTSKTQHLDEGHISKSIKQVYASMWNFRAYDERDFYRVDQYIASMGVLCHPNYSDELSNGVAVSLDPIYQTEGTYYLNTQLGEDLVTNPDALSIPEEVLIEEPSSSPTEPQVVRYSNLVGLEELVMDQIHYAQLREFLGVIHSRFQILYDAVGSEGFAMDIEYKVTSEGQLVIKQARPWTAFWADLETSIERIEESVNVRYFPNPVGDYLTIECDCIPSKIRISNLIGQEIFEQAVDFEYSKQQISVQNLSSGIYVMSGIGADGEIYFAKKFIKE